MKRSEGQSEIIVIYDGECAFCKECVRWLARRVTVIALPFQSADLAQFNLTYERCSKEVVAIIDGKVLGGSSAVAALLKVNGHRVLGNLMSLLTSSAGNSFSSPRTKPTHSPPKTAHILMDSSLKVAAGTITRTTSSTLNL